MVWKSVISGITLLPVCPWLLNLNQHLLPKILPNFQDAFHPKSFILPSSQASKMQCLHRRWHHGRWWTQQVPQELLLHATRRWGWRWHHLQSVSQVSVEVASHPIKLIFLRLKNGGKIWIFLKPNIFFRRKRFWGKIKREESQTLWVKNWFCIRIISKSIKLPKKSYSPEN